MCSFPHGAYENAVFYPRAQAGATCTRPSRPCPSARNAAPSVRETWEGVYHMLPGPEPQPNFYRLSVIVPRCGLISCDHGLQHWLQVSDMAAVIAVVDPADGSESAAKTS